MNKQFSGTTRECFHHYAENFFPPKGDRKSSKAKEPIANFIGVGEQTINRWMTDRNKPLGESLTRLRFYLEAHGYYVSEISSLEKGSINYMLAEMLGYGVLTCKQAINYLDFKEEKSIYRIANGGAGTNPERAEKIREMHEIYDKELRAAKEKLRSEIDNEKVVKKTIPEVISFPEPKPQVTKEDTIDDESMEILAHLILAITPLLKKAVTGTTKEQRNKLRKLTGDGGMFELSKASSRLCSEKAREII